jgi:replicative DNA helicase
MFPLDSLPAWQRGMVEAVAAATKTDPSIAAMMSIAVASGAVGRKVVIRTDSELTPPLNVWVLVVMGTGQAKSPIFGSMVHPLTLVQRAVDAPATATGQPRPTVLRRISVWERLRENPYAEQEGAAIGVDLEAAVRAMREEQEGVYPGVGVDFLTDDLTPTALVETAGSQVSAIAWMAPEGGFDTWIGSGARGTNNMRILNKAWDCDDIRSGRVGLRRTAERPCLAMGVMVHPEVAASVLRNRAMTARGYSYRFLVLVPTEHIGGKEGPFARIPQEVADRYRRAVWSLLALPSLAHGQGRTPHTLSLSLSANQTYWDFFKRMQARIVRGGDLHDLHGWIEKTCQSTIRIAGLLHLAENAPSVGDDAYDISISDSTMGKAIAIGEYLIPHARIAFGASDAPKPLIRGGLDHAAPAPRILTLVDAIVAMIDGTLGKTWSGTSTDLLQALDAHVPVLQRETGWPHSAPGLTLRLAELDEELRRRGLFNDPRRSAKSRRIVISRP